MLVKDIHEQQAEIVVNPAQVAITERDDSVSLPGTAEEFRNALVIRHRQFPDLPFQVLLPGSIVQQTQLTGVTELCHRELPVATAQETDVCVKHHSLLLALVWPIVIAPFFSRLAPDEARRELRE
jgi:hypothetical protein